MSRWLGTRMQPALTVPGDKCGAIGKGLTEQWCSVLNGLKARFIHLIELLLFRPKLFQISRCTALSRVCPIMAYRELYAASNPAMQQLSNVHENTGSDAANMSATLSKLLSSPHPRPAHSPAALLPRILEELRRRHHRACLPASRASARWQGH